MKTSTSQKPKAVDYLEGEELLRKAFALEKESSQTYGEWILWIKDGNVPVIVVAEQISNIKSIQPDTAKREAERVLRLTLPDNQSHLDALVEGLLPYRIALLKVTPGAPRPTKQIEDDELAVQYQQHALKIMLKLHGKEWKLMDYVNWFTSLLEKAQGSNSN